VMTLNRDEMTNLCESRVIFETAFFERAVKKISRNVFKKYKQRLQQAADQMIAFKGDPEELQNKHAEYLKIDFEFHIRLVAASDNKLWLELYNSILDRFRIYSLLTQKRFPSFYPDAHNEHIAILKFILDEDFSEAKWLLRKHLQNFLVRTLKLYTER
jgi:DNA-binding GntR family transcriptional regulator